MSLCNPIAYKRVNYQDFLGILLFFTLPFYHKFSNLTIGVIIFFSVVEVYRGKKLPSARLFWFLPILFLYYLISGLASGGTLSELEKRFLLLAIPIAFVLNPNFFQESLRKKIYKAFISGNLLAAIICFGVAMARSCTFHDGQLKFNAKVIPDSQFDFLTSSVMGGNYFFGDEFSIFLDPIYFGLFIVFAQYLIFEIIRSSPYAKQSSWLLGSYTFLLVVLFLLSSKASLIASLILTCYIAIYFLFTTKVSRSIRLATLFSLTIFGALFIFFNPRMKVFKDSFSVGRLANPDPETRDGFDLRILSWKASLSVIKDNWVLGVGEGKKRETLVEVYKEKGYIAPSRERHNSHNQYLDFLIGGGVIGLSIFIIGLIQLFVRSFTERNFPLLAFLSIFCFISLFENLLSRHAGILLFAAFITLLGTKR